MRDLLIVEQVNSTLNYRLPVYYNHLLQGGYINMPSARMGCEGEVGAGYSHVPPYNNYNLRLQFTDRIEISGNYRIFSGIDDPNLSHAGFGDFSDKGANIKVALLHPEDSYFVLPGIAVGYEDFIGTKAFEAKYIVATQVFPGWDLEVSLGYGEKRIRDLFGGISWMPFRKCCWPYLEDIALVVEYDAIPYKSKKREPHPHGRTKRAPINVGVKERLWNMIDLSASYIRGKEFAFSASTFYNFGTTRGILPKINEPLPYRAPKNTQCTGPLRSDDDLVIDFFYPMRDQGFDLLDLWLSCDKWGHQSLRMRILNPTYRYERDVRNRLNDLLANLTPSNIDHVVVTIEEEGIPIQEYHYSMEFVRLYAKNKVCPYELFILSPLCEASRPNRCCSKWLFHNRKEWVNVELLPKTTTVFGSATGKFKYSLGLHLGLNGYLWGDIYYSTLFGYNIRSKLYDVRDVDKLNPSQLINVRTDMVNYFKQEGITVDEAFLQKNLNLGCGWYTRLAGGLFEEAYGGLASELLYYPVNSSWACGIEGAHLRKRTFKGVGFTDVIRKLEGYKPTYHKFRGSQYFLNFYYNLKELDLDLALKGGRFLAKDWGIKTEVARYYPSGFRVFFWYTYTDGKDRVNGHRYYDKGVGFSMPLDIFYTHSSRRNWGYAMAAWLRDVGAIAANGIPLYYPLRAHREER